MFYITQIRYTQAGLKAMYCTTSKYWLKLGGSVSSIVMLQQNGFNLGSHEMSPQKIEQWTVRTTTTVIISRSKILPLPLGGIVSLKRS